VVHCIKDNSIPRLFNSQSLHVVSHVPKYRFLLPLTNLNTSSQTKWFCKEVLIDSFLKIYISKNRKGKDT
jgi:hypothetical protein